MVQRIFPIRSMRIDWRLLLLTVLVFGTATYSSSAKSAGDIVAYVLMAKGEISRKHSRGSSIKLGTSINLRPGDQLVVFHVGTCHRIRISGAISLRFKRGSYQPRTAPEIEVLRTVCAPVCRPKGDAGGITTRGLNSQKVNSTPNFLIHRNRLEVVRIELSDKQDPSDKRVLDIPPNTSLLRWPNEVAPLHAGKTYEMMVIGSGKSIDLDTQILVENVSNPDQASNLVIVELSESK